ncbi:hypothetical protein BDV25DRAFT_137083 [Aspergillus avenaceus]|uniref:Rhodopsin domain-containing protein n=1 Tax=Aspergillus avenaceus TaxID=36643 RepID=A0A5N6U436_ASPAV|nr:hypothetical protein BDV25DRAFT_137083 [Aspergillus avenaceus]
MTRFLEDSWNPAVTVTAWFLMSTTVLAVIPRLITKWLIFRKLTVDDYMVVVSTLFCIANAIAIFVATTNGYGDHTGAVSRAKQETVMKSQLAATLLATLSMLFSKLAMSVFIRNLTPTSRDILYAHIVQGLVVAITAVTLFGSSFQCHWPDTWDYMTNTCINRVAWATFVALTNAMTDVLIIMQAMVLIGRVQTTWQKKLVFASIFLPRLCVVAAEVTRIALIHTQTIRGDPFMDTAPSTISTEFAQFLSIITACWGQLRPFLTRLRSNAFRIHGTEWPSTSYYERSRVPESHTRTRTTTTYHGQTHELQELVPQLTNGTRAKILTPGVAFGWESASHSSQTHIIQETTWALTEARSESTASDVVKS